MENNIPTIQPSTDDQRIVFQCGYRDCCHDHGILYMEIEKSKIYNSIIASRIIQLSSKKPMLNLNTTHKEYAALRSRLVKSRDAIGKAHKESEKLSELLFQNDLIQKWNEVNAIQGKLWESYCSIDTLIIRLDQEYSELNNSQKEK